MAKNYFNMTGVLVLSKVTPVIKALFGAFELAELPSSPGHAYIANISDSTNCKWAAVLEKLIDLQKGLVLPASDCEYGDMESVLQSLAKHFGAEQNEELHNLVEFFVLDQDADLRSLFVLARAFDDGHGLTAINTQTSWHSDMPKQLRIDGSGDSHGKTHTVKTILADLLAV